MRSLLHTDLLEERNMNIIINKWHINNGYLAKSVELKGTRRFEKLHDTTRSWTCHV